LDKAWSVQLRVQDAEAGRVGQTKRGFGKLNPVEDIGEIRGETGADSFGDSRLLAKGHINVSARQPAYRAALLIGVLAIPVFADQLPYQKPNKEILDILNIPATPALAVNPTRTYATLSTSERYPGIAEVSEPMLRLAGLRIDARTNGLHLAPHSIAIGPGGDIYIADTLNCRVRKIDSKSGVISTFAGTGQKGFGGDGGAAGNAEFGNIYCVAFDPKLERMYLADLDNRRIRMIDMKNGIVSTVAGNGKKGVPKDGEDATDQPLVDPRAVAADGTGNIYVLERSGNALRVVDPSGKIRTVAGTGKAGYSGDGGPGLQAMMNGPKHLVVQKNGDVLIADTEIHVIRRLKVKEGTIELVAGAGKIGSGGVGGPAEKCQLARPHGVFERADGTIFIADSENNRILKIDLGR